MVEHFFHYFSVVKTFRFWRNHAKHTEIKAKRGKTRKPKIGEKANLGGMMKELGCEVDGLVVVDEVFVVIARPAGGRSSVLNVFVEQLAF